MRKIIIYHPVVVEGDSKLCFDAINSVEEGHWSISSIISNVLRG